MRVSSSPRGTDVQVGGDKISAEKHMLDRGQLPGYQIYSSASREGCLTADGVVTTQSRKNQRSPTCVAWSGKVSSLLCLLGQGSMPAHRSLWPCAINQIPRPLRP